MNKQSGLSFFIWSLIGSSFFIFTMVILLNDADIGFIDWVIQVLNSA